MVYWCIDKLGDGVNKMIWYLIFLAVFSLIALIVSFLNLRTILRNGRQIKFNKLRVLVSWLLLFVFIGSVGGATYLGLNHGQSTSQKSDAVKTSQTSSSSSSSKKPAVGNLKVTYSPGEPIIYGDSVKVTFKVPAKAKLKIVAHYSGLTYKTFTNHHNKASYFKFDFDEASTFDLVVTKNGHKKTQKITIEQANNTAQSTQTSAVSTSSYSEQSSSTTTTDNTTTDATQASSTATTDTNTQQ